MGLNDGQDEVAAIKSIHQDLLALSQSRFPAIEKLCHDLEAHVDAFRKLLDKNPKNEKSRVALAAEHVDIQGVQYSLNNEFREQSITLADMLSLDELECAKLLLNAGRDAEKLDRPLLASAVIRFHEFRSFLVESLRLILKISLDIDIEEGFREIMQMLLNLVVRGDSHKTSGASAYVQKCIKSMLDIEQWLSGLSEQAQKAITLGQTSTPDSDEIMGFQQLNLTQQHESLGTVVLYLVKAKLSSIEDFKTLTDQMSLVDKWNSTAVHYAPAIIAFCGQVGSTDGSASLEEARSIHSKLLDARESKPWPLRNLQAATTIWWLAEYNSWYFDPPDDLTIEGTDAAKETEARNDALLQAIRDGGFQCILSICSHVKSSDWYDPARIGLIQSLLNDTPVLPFEPSSVSTYFRDALMEELEAFTYAFVANMPDVLRKFKMDEEDQRRKMLSAFQPNLQGEMSQHDRHLERFFVIMSYAYEGRSDVSANFWQDTESNLYGFLQWFSRRVSTPLVGAFCEMFRAISEGEYCAECAHQFLLDDPQGMSSRIRRGSSLTWAQIFEELDFYASKIRDNPSASLSAASNYSAKGTSIDVDEPETPVMLECYLRLMAHLCAESRVVRQWVLSHPTFRIIDTVFLLSNASVPSRIRACSFQCLQAVLTEKKTEMGDAVWFALDQWVVSGFSAGVVIPRPVKAANSSTVAEDFTFESIIADVDEMSSFVLLLQSLVSPSLEAQELNDALPFPEQLGSSYRMAGIEPYIDLVMGKIFAQRLSKFEGKLMSHILAYRVLRFVEICLETFNEDLVVLADESRVKLDDAISSTSLVSYVSLHPFGRVIEWMFNEKVVTALFAIAHLDISDISTAQADSPLLLALTTSVRVMNLVMSLQSTYLDRVRPMVKTQSLNRRQPVLNPSIASFEDCVASHLRIVADLSYYAGSGSQELALASIELLKKFSASRKLNVFQQQRYKSGIQTNRLIGVLQQNNDIEPVARSLSQSMDFDANELGQGPNSPGFNIKFAILDFLTETLLSNPNSPSLAHAFLGFECVGQSISILASGSFAKRSSLFHSVLQLSLNYPDSLDGNMLFWCLSLKTKALHVLELLWTSPMTSEIVMADMRAGQILFTQWLLQYPVDSKTLWEGVSAQDASFLFSDSASVFGLFLLQRSRILHYAAIELRSVSLEDTAMLRSRTVSTLMGTTRTDSGDYSNLSIFDLLDFLDLGVPEFEPNLNVQQIQGVELEVCLTKNSSGYTHFNMKLLEELLALQHNHLRKVGDVRDENIEERLQSEERDFLNLFNGFNNVQRLKEARINALQAWAELVILTSQTPGMSKSDQSNFILRSFQVIAPKLEIFAYSTKPEALILAHLTQTLLTQLDLQSEELSAGHTGDIARDRLHQVFKIMLRAISNPEADATLREPLYNICYQYLARSSTELASSWSIGDVLKGSGDNLIDIISEDAYAGTGTARIIAVLFLDALVLLAAKDSSSHMIEALSRTNLLIVLVESIKDMPDEITSANSQDISYLITYYKAKLSLLTTISETRPGAVQVFNSGLFAAIKNSGLFAMDPDLGLDVDDPQAMKRFFELLVSVSSLIAAVVLGLGAKNKYSMDSARSFLAENRASVIGAFKRQAKYAYFRRDEDDAETLDLVNDLAEIYVLLIHLTSFLEFEDNRDMPKRRRVVFS